MTAVAMLSFATGLQKLLKSINTCKLTKKKQPPRKMTMTKKRVDTFVTIEVCSAMHVSLDVINIYQWYTICGLYN